MKKDRAATAPLMGRKPLGGTGETTVMVPMRWAASTLAEIDAARGDQDRSGFIRDAVMKEVDKRKG